MNAEQMETIFAEFQRSLILLDFALSSDKFTELLPSIGWQVPSESNAQLRALVHAWRSLLDHVIAVATTLDEGDVSIEMMNGLASLPDDVRNVQMALRSTFRDAPGDAVDAIVFQLLEDLLIRQINVSMPWLYAAGRLLGVIRLVSRPLGGSPYWTPGARRTFSFEQLSQLLSDPVQALTREYGLDRLDASALLVSRALFNRCNFFLESLGFQSRFDDSDGSMNVLLGYVDDRSSSLTLRLIHDREAIYLQVQPSGNITFTVPLSERANASISLNATSSFTVGARGVVGGEAGPLRGRLDVHVLAADEGTSVRVGTRYETGPIHIVVSLQQQSPRELEFSIALSMLAGSLLLSSSETDGFLRSIFPDGGVRIDCGFCLGWSNRTGVSFGGGSGLDTVFPMHLSVLGLVAITEVRLRLRVDNEGLRFSLGASLRTRLGPIHAGVVGIGIETRFGASRRGGNLGFFDLSLGFKPPSGLDISIRSGPVCGGGFIAYDEALGRYSGALSLAIGDIALRALGILDTRAPGVSGYSFLIVISAEFTPIQLGFGFTLMGVGGLCGIQRAVSVPALQEGVRSGTLASLLFSRDPIGQATQLIAGLQRAFPPTQGRYVFGPMFKLGWGTPTLLTADLGIILQLPSPIVIALLGTLSAKLPRPEAAVVEINLDILGVLDLGEKKLSIDASLRDSRIAAFTLTGDLALRYHWGNEPDFALSLGGFNPDFRPPPNFPTLRRLSLALGNGNNPRLSLSAYFALTSNSLQFGARAEVYAEALGFNLLGYLEFHALFIFSPFSFRFDFSAGVALRRGTSVLMAISVVGRIEGPRPWRVQGRATASILFFEVTVSFDETFGDPPDPARLPPVDVWVPLRAALGDLRNWSATLPEGQTRCVSTAADHEQPPRVRLDPQSVLTVRQKVMPLERRITKLGEQPVAAPTRVRVTAVRVGCAADGSGGTVVAHEGASEPFAAAQYEALSDAQRLSRPSFEPMVAGAQAQGRALKTERAVTRRPRVETIRVGRTGSTTAAMLRRMQEQAAQVDSANVAALRTEGMARYAPGVGATPMLSLAPEQWTVASTADLRQAPGATPGPWGAVAEGGRDEDERGVWQVVPSYEVRR